MLTIFAIPKPFQGRTAIIQRNAIRSWAALDPPCEMILFGDDEGVAETAAELGTRHVPSVPKNQYGTPLLDFCFERAQQLASHELVCYVNADMMLLDDFLPAIRQIRFPVFLMVGRRRNVDVTGPWDFETADWQERLRGLGSENGMLGQPGEIDYFVFPRGVLGTLPPFAVGRPGWDNWVIYRARFLRVPVVDATQIVFAIHQNHDYSHVQRGTGRKWEGPEAEHNLDLIGSLDHAFNLTDANWVLTSRGLRRQPLTLDYLHLYRLMMRLSALYPSLRPVISPARVLWRWVRDTLKYACWS